MLTKINGSYVIAFDGISHILIKNGEVVYEDDKIVYVGKSYGKPADQTIDAKGRLISPGLINMQGLTNICITHLKVDNAGPGLAVSKTYAEDGKGVIEFNKKEVEISATFSIAQLLKGGATTIVNVTAMAPSRFEGPKDESKIIAEKAEKMGARIYVGYNYRSGIKYLTEKGATKYYWDEEAGRRGLDNAVEFVKRYKEHSNERINGFLFPFQLDTCSPELLQATKEAAEELNVFKKVHTSQYRTEFHEIKRRYGKTPIKFLSDINFLDPKTFLIHAIWTTNHLESGYPFSDLSDLELISKTNTTIVHCPVVFSRAAEFLHSFSLYQKTGINITLGTDAAPYDMLQEMQYAAVLGKVADRTRTGVTAKEVYNAATINAAKALNRDDLGRLAPGMKADITIFDLRPFHMSLIDDPIKSLIYFGSQNIVETVIIDGKIVVENHHISNLNEEELGKKANEINQKQKKAFADNNPLKIPLNKLFPPTFKTI